MDTTHKNSNSKLPFPFPFLEEDHHHHQIQYPSFFTHFPQNPQTHFTNFHPFFSTMDFNDMNMNEDTAKGSSFTPFEEALLSGDSCTYSDVVGETCAKSDTDSCSEVGEVDDDDDDDDDEVSLDEFLLLSDANAKKKIEVLAKMVGVESTEPGMVLAEVVRVLKHLKRINKF